MMRNYYERLADVFEVKIQLCMQSILWTANIDPLVRLCCFE